MPKLIFFLEEASAKAFLQELLPRLFPQGGIRFLYKVYEGKSDLRENAAKDMRACSFESDARFLLLHDQDCADCKILKAKLSALCADWLDKLIIRIACKELESWYLAQLSAVEQAFGVDGLAGLQNKAKFREPERLTTPDNILNDLLMSRKKAYSKINGSRQMGKYVDPECGRSVSFRHFIRAVRLSVQKAAE